MELNFIGLIAAISTFTGVWLGHVAVRKIEFISPTIWIPAAAFTALGLAALTYSLFTSHFPLSTALGILGLTILWDALESIRQQSRVKKGHAPANPNNPRHARILAEHPSATTLNLLKRQPVGRPVSAEEAIQLVKHAGHKES